MKLGLLRLLQLVIGLALTLLICSCGGSGGNASFGPAGSLTFQKEIVADTTAIDLVDPNSVLRVIAPAGAIAAGQKVKIEVWSSQRELVQLKNFSQTPVAADLIIAPGALGENVIDVEMAGSMTPGLGMMLSAFGPDGKLIALPNADGATAPLYRGKLNADMISYLAGTSPKSLEPVRIQIVAQSIVMPTSKGLDQASTPKLSTVFSRPAESRKSYASRRRIAVVLSGMLDPVPNPKMAKYLDKLHTKDEDPADQTFAYDEITTFTYEWTDAIAVSATKLKEALDAKYADPNKFEIDFFGHGEGGLVCRWATEKLGLAATKRLFLMGTPQRGYPTSIIQGLLLNFAPQAGTGLIPNIGKLFDGLGRLDQSAQVFKDLAESSPVPGAKYYFISGTKPLCQIFTKDLSSANDRLYRFAGFTANDGLVSKESSVYAPSIQAPNAVTSGQGHFELCDDMATVFDAQSRFNWVWGANRDIASLSAQVAFETVLASESIELRVVAKDKDGDELDENILFDPKGVTFQSPLRWTSSDPSVVSVPESTQRLAATVRGNRAGDATVTVRDPLKGESFTFTIKVVNNTTVILPNRPDLQLGEEVTFSASPIEGTYPKGSAFQWSVRRGLLRPKGSNQPGSTTLVADDATEVVYTAPDEAVPDRISVFVFVKNRLTGKGATDIFVGAPFRINPNESVVPSSGFQTFTVEALGIASLPPGGSYKWAVTGGGNLSSQTTSTPTVDYTAPLGQADPTLSVEILDADGAKVGAASTTIKVRPGNFQFTATNINPFVTGEIVNGEYNGPLVQISRGIVGSVYRIGLVFGVTEGPGVTPDTAAWVVQIAISQGSRLQAGQTFPLGQVTTPGVFYASSVLTPSSGTLKILTSRINNDNTHTYTYSITLDAYMSNTGGEAKVVDGTGSFTLAY